MRTLRIKSLEVGETHGGYGPFCGSWLNRLVGRVKKIKNSGPSRVSRSREIASWIDRKDIWTENLYNVQSVPLTF